MGTSVLKSQITIPSPIITTLILLITFNSPPKKKKHFFVYDLITSKGSNTLTTWNSCKKITEKLGERWGGSGHWTLNNHKLERV